MHTVIWTLGNCRYATPTRDVVEVTPIVQTRPWPKSEPWLQGLMNYRGRLVPVVDVASLIGVAPTTHRLYGRIIVVNGNGNHDAELIALAVEAVLGGEELDFDAHDRVELNPSQGVPFLGPLAQFEFATVQLTDATKIVIPRRLEGVGKASS